MYVAFMAILSSSDGQEVSYGGREFYEENLSVEEVKETIKSDFFGYSVSLVVLLNVMKLNGESNAKVH